MGHSARSILIINPNTTQEMTDSLRPLIESLELTDTKFHYFTAPAGVPSINNADDGRISADACLPSLKGTLQLYDAFLVCCYSAHPLVPQLRLELHRAGLDSAIVGGIFESSVMTALQLLSPHEKFGIVSTGQQWTKILGDAVQELLDCGRCNRYAGTETTGLNADELHTTSKPEVDRRMKEATKVLLSRDVKAICLGCAGMAGMSQVVRQACVEHLGQRQGRAIKIIDGVVSGALFVESALRASKASA